MGEACAERVDRGVARSPAVPAIFLLLLAGCFPDDWDGSPYEPDGSAGSVEDTSAPATGPALVGDWRSEGADLSPLFSGEPFHYEVVEVELSGGGAYVVTSVDRDGAEYVLSGTFTASEATDPATVSLRQTEPYEAEAEGIWQVQGEVLTWEVVQTVPDYGFAPPSPQEGFGSTSGPGLQPGSNVQVYRRIR